MPRKHPNANRRRLLTEPLEDRRMLATITVTSLLDGTLAQLAGDGQVSLREAVAAANSNSSIDGSVAGAPGEDTIVFDPALSGAVFLGATGQLTVTESLTIRGNGTQATNLNGQNLTRILEVPSSSTALTIQQMTLRLGRTTGDDEPGGAIRAHGPLVVDDSRFITNRTLGDESPGGAIYVGEDQTITVTNSLFDDNETRGDDSWGGAIAFNAQAFITDSEFINNSTDGFSGFGGAVSAQGTGSELDIQSSVFTNNHTNGMRSHGGAILANWQTTIADSQFTNNSARNTLPGGSSYGGAFFSTPSSTTVIDNSVFDNNSASGSGGALYTYALEMRDSHLEGNTGSKSGGGLFAGRGMIENTTITGNSSAERGGGIRAVSIDVINSTLSDNRARSGAGILFDSGLVHASTISGNTATDSGGGIYLRSRPFGAEVVNSTITGNRVLSAPVNSGGGGIYVSSNSLSVSHTTIAGNTVAGAAAGGGGIQGVGQADVYLFNTIVAGNFAFSGFGPDLRVESAAGFSSSYSLIGDNTDSPLSETNPNRDGQGNLVGGPTQGIVDPLLGVLKNRGGTTETRSLSLVSPAIDFRADLAGGLLPINDQRGAGFPRNDDGDRNGTAHVDTGAWELRVLVRGVVGFELETLIGQVNYGREDLARFNPDTGAWSMFFDGSDVGLAGAAIDAHHQDADGSILFSFSQIVTIPGIGDVLPADIVRFIPTSLGDFTAGTFESVVTGFDLGLDGSVDNIDAIGRANNGQLVISTDDDVFLDFGVAQAHDLLMVDGQFLMLYFDGEDVGLTTADENITGLWFEPDTDLMFMTTQGPFDVEELSGNEGDVIAFAAKTLEEDTTGKFYAFDMPGFDLDQAPAGLNIQYEDEVATMVGDWVFEDRNGNGIQDAGESGIAGVVVELLNPVGQILDQTETDALGRYQFTELNAGDYRLRVQVPTGFQLTAADQGSDDTRDSDFQPGTRLSPLFSITDGEVETSIDAGLIPPAVDGDFNDDGLYDCADIDALVGEIVAATNNPQFDLTGDAVVNTADRDAWLAEAGAANLGPGKAYLPGDATLDGFVDGQDFILWNDNKFTTAAQWCLGDFTADGVIDGQDFITWNLNKFQSSDQVARITLSPVPKKREGAFAPPQMPYAGDIPWATFSVLETLPRPVNLRAAHCISRNDRLVADLELLHLNDIDSHATRRCNLYTQRL